MPELLTKTISFAEYLLLPYDGKKTEFVNGQIVNIAEASPLHVLIIELLQTLLDRHVEEIEAELETYAGVGIEIPRTDRKTKQLQELPTFVAVLDKIDSGIVRSSPHPRETAVAELISMWVTPNARGSGLSEVLIDAVIDWARTERYCQLVLDVSDDNKFAIALYKSKGFQATGITNSFPYPRAHIKEHEMAMDL